MARGKKPLLENIEIKKIAAEGKSIAYVDEKVLFVPNTVPGDIVDVQVTRKRKSFLEGFIVNVRKYSDIRTEPFCSHFGGAFFNELDLTVFDTFRNFRVDQQDATTGRCIV